MFEYHGWLSTFETVDAKAIQDTLQNINEPYPASAKNVNGRLHVSFSGNPNRDLGQVKNIVSYLCGLNEKLSGCIYINDANSERYNRFDVIKIIEDKDKEIEDQNFTIEETKKLFE
jgi:hypothetical protein